MVRLTAAERDFLIAAYGAGARTVAVLRCPGPPHARLLAGRRRLVGSRRLRALASLYSRGLVAQTTLNRFALTAHGRSLIRLLSRGRSERSGTGAARPHLG